MVMSTFSKTPLKSFFPRASTLPYFPSIRLLKIFETSLLFGYDICYFDKVIPYFFTALKIKK